VPGIGHTDNTPFDIDKAFRYRCYRKIDSDIVSNRIDCIEAHPGKTCALSSTSAGRRMWSRIFKALLNFLIRRHFLVCGDQIPQARSRISVVLGIEVHKSVWSAASHSTFSFLKEEAQLGLRMLGDFDWIKLLRGDSNREPALGKKALIIFESEFSDSKSTHVGRTGALRRAMWTAPKRWDFQQVLFRSSYLLHISDTTRHYLQVEWLRDEKHFEKRVKEHVKLLKGKRLRPDSFTKLQSILYTFHHVTLEVILLLLHRVPGKITLTCISKQRLVGPASICIGKWEWASLHHVKSIWPTGITSPHCRRPSLAFFTF
jgi:hypothetical protein